MTVLIAVAASESVFLIPHFARIVVSPANSAEPNAKRIHMRNTMMTVFVGKSCYRSPFVRSMQKPSLGGESFCICERLTKSSVNRGKKD